MYLLKRLANRRSYVFDNIGVIETGRSSAGYDDALAYFGSGLILPVLQQQEKLPTLLNFLYIIQIIGAKILAFVYMLGY